MKILLQILFLIIACNLAFGQTSKKTADGAIRFKFVDNNKKSIQLDECIVTYDKKVNVTLRPDTSDFKSSLIKTTPGLHTFQIKTDKYQDIIITDVKITEGKTNFVTIPMTYKISADDKTTVRIKYKDPQGENCGQ